MQKNLETEWPETLNSPQSDQIQEIEKCECTPPLSTDEVKNILDHLSYDQKVELGLAVLKRLFR